MGFDDRSAAILATLCLLVQQVSGLPIGLIEDVGVELRRYSWVDVLRKLRQHVNDVQLGADSLRDVRCHPHRQGRVSGAVGAKRIFVRNAFTFPSPLSPCPASRVTVPCLPHDQHGARGVTDNRIGDAPHESSPHSTKPSAPHHYEPSVYLLSQIDDLFVRPSYSEVSSCHVAPRSPPDFLITSIGAATPCRLAPSRTDRGLCGIPRILFCGNSRLAPVLQ